MKTYELTYIISPDITSEEAEAKAREIESAVQKNEGAILGQTNPSAKTLAYPIKNRASGFFGFVEFQMEPEKVPELEKIVSKNAHVVRHMITKKEIRAAKKERRVRMTSFQKENIKPDKSPEGHFDESAVIPAKRDLGGGKMELKNIEEKLDEILGE